MEEAVQQEERIDREVIPEVAERRNRLFRQYVKPYKNLIYWCCIKYSDQSENVEENYTMALTNLFRGIETYDPSRPILPWLHFVTKRYVMNINKGRYEANKIRDAGADIRTCEDSLSYSTSDEVRWNAMTIENYKQLYSDEVLQALASMKPTHRDALLLQQAGYTLAEIAEIEYQKGNLDSRNIDTVKSRLFLARQHMKKRITRDGKRRTD